jgi:hypothetical protein
MHILMKCTFQEAKSPVKNLVHIYIYIYNVNFLALLRAPYICNISRLRVILNLVLNFTSHFFRIQSFFYLCNEMCLIDLLCSTKIWFLGTFTEF